MLYASFQDHVWQDRILSRCGSFRSIVVNRDGKQIKAGDTANVYSMNTPGDVYLEK